MNLYQKFIRLTLLLIISATVMITELVESTSSMMLDGVHILKLKNSLIVSIY